MYPFRMAIDYRVFDTFLVTVATVYSFVNHAIYTNKEDELFIYTMVESAITFITWIYYLVLSITATRFPLMENQCSSLHSLYLTFDICSCKLGFSSLI
jgi:citrate lyase synthetase